MKFDDILTQIGEFGPYQRFQYCLLCLTALTTAMQTFNTVYLLKTPNFRCRLPEHIWPNDTYAIQGPEHELLVKQLIPMASRTHYETCFMVNTSSVNLTQVESADMANGSITDCNDGWLYDKSEFVDTFISEFNIVCDDKIWNLYITQSYMFGVLIGATILGWISDKFGRKNTILVGIGLHIISSFGNCFSSDVYSMIAFRFAAGVSSQGLFPIAFVLAMEIVGPSMRTHAGIIIEYVYASGIMILALVAYFFRYWRHLQLAISSITPLFLAYWWFLHESPRWLFIQGRSDEANVVLQKFAKSNKKELPDEVKDGIKDEEILKSEDEIEPITAIFSYPRFLGRFVNICFQWFVSAMLYFGLSLNTGELKGNIYVNSFLSGLVEIPGYMVPHFIIGLLGRRIPNVVSTITSGVACACTIIFSHSEHDLKTYVTVLALIGKCFNTAAFAILFIWSTELLPTNIRNVGIGVAGMTGSFGSLIGPVIFELKSVDKGHLGNGLPLLIFGLFALAAGILSFILPETLNRPLPQTLKDTVKKPTPIPVHPEEDHNLMVNDGKDENTKV